MKRVRASLTRLILILLSVFLALKAMEFLSKMLGKKTEMVEEKDALAGRGTKMAVSGSHSIFKNKLDQEFKGMEMLQVGMGCFWGAEKKFWTVDGVVSTAVGYSGGYTPNPSYEEVCSGMTGHNEVVRVVFDPTKTSVSSLLKVFWESHNPTQGNRQGNDVGSQYRSAIYYYSEEQKEQAVASKKMYQERLTAKGYGKITTEILPSKTFYFAEDYHQQYLKKNPRGYCGLGGTGVSCPVSFGISAE
mmetsp:Transcript_9783/g.14235  ORF Transcript_9783/g.14235 Transcript_9783/m.14235 type:complete len:246 (-) Transcript_9783:51-788(-)